MKKRNGFKNVYVRQGGKIFPWGMIRVFSNLVTDDPEDNYGGGSYWSRKLMPYGDGKHFAKIVEGNIEIFSKETNLKVTTIYFKSLVYTSDVTVARVHEMGYLQAIGVLGMMFSNHHNDFSRTLSALRKAVNKEPLTYRDNSPFVKVSETLIGQDLIRIDIGMGTADKYKVFTFEGSPVKCKVSHPLRYNFWVNLRSKSRIFSGEQFQTTIDNE